MDNAQMKILNDLEDCIIKVRNDSGKNKDSIANELDDICDKLKKLFKVVD